VRDYKHIVATERYGKCHECLPNQETSRPHTLWVRVFSTRINPMYLELCLPMLPKRHMPRIGDTWGAQGHQLRPHEYGDAYPYSFSINFER
jgi:hypothetical protein